MRPVTWAMVRVILAAVYVFVALHWRFSWWAVGLLVANLLYQTILFSRLSHESTP